MRVEAEDAEEWIDDERAMPMVIRGQEMRGWLQMVSDLTDPELQQWVTRGLAYARSLPHKSR